MSGHTPGPWRAEFSDHGGYDCMTGAWRIGPESTRRCLADIDLGSYGQRRCDFGFRSPEAEANARLIAAAPELLSALRLMESVYRLNCVAEGEPSSVLEAIQAVIAKAEGR